MTGQGVGRRAGERSGGIATAPRPGVWVETATWPPVEVHEFDGWRVGYSGGFTRRGNSALPPRSTPGDEPTGLASTLGRVEAFYAARSAPAVVRVDPAARPRLDSELAARGYLVSAPTTVMVAPTDRAARARVVRSGAPESHGRQYGTSQGAAEGAVPESAVPESAGPGNGPALRITAADAPDADWLAAWLGVKATATRDHDLAARLLRGAPARYLTARDGTGVVGVLRAAPSGRWVGLSCLAVAERARRRGIGRRLTERALDETSARWAFLQVEESNQAAAGLYAGLGFAVADRYHYRQR